MRLMSGIFLAVVITTGILVAGCSSDNPRLQPPLTTVNPVTTKITTPTVIVTSPTPTSTVVLTYVSPDQEFTDMMTNTLGELRPLMGDLNYAVLSYDRPAVRSISWDFANCCEKWSPMIENVSVSDKLVETKAGFLASLNAMAAKSNEISDIGGIDSNVIGEVTSLLTHFKNATSYLEKGRSAVCEARCGNVCSRNGCGSCDLPECFPYSL